MQNLSIRKIIVIFAVLLLVLSRAEGQQPSSEEKTLALLIRTLQEKIQRKQILEKQKSRWLQRLQQRSTEIARMKKKSQNPLQSRQLEHLLRETQRLSADLQDLQAQIQQLDDTLRTTARVLVEEIDRELIVTFRHLRDARQNSRSHRQALQKIIQLYQLRLSYQKYAGPTFRLARLLPIRFDSTDTPEERQRKRSIVQDQIDYLYSLKTALKEKERQAREWANLYRLSGNLLKDLQFQETRDEALAKGNRAGTPSALNQPGKNPEGLSTKQALSSWPAAAPYPASPNFATLPAYAGYILTLPPDQLSQQLPVIQKLVRQIQTMADSLQQLLNSRPPK